MTLLELLRNSLREALRYDHNVKVRPACILWPDENRQWAGVVDKLMAVMPELFRLGAYDREKRTGPAIWLRCVLANCIDGISLPGDLPPVFYLPGCGRLQLRDAKSSDEIAPLVELMYRSSIWSHVNGKDWTVNGFLVTPQDSGGLGLNVAKGAATLQALQRALPRLLDEDIDNLRGKLLDQQFFNQLLTGSDPVLDVLRWLEDPEAFQTSLEGSGAWNAFADLCEARLRFHPDKLGVLGAARLLGCHGRPWDQVWARYCEAPARYPHIEDLLRRSTPPKDNVLWLQAGPFTEGWPQWNDEQENALDQELHKLALVPEHEARERILALEKEHGGRRSLVWAELGQAPLACALEHLAIVAGQIAANPATGSVEELAARYAASGWSIDDHALRALDAVEDPHRVQGVITALRAIYLPWLEEGARHLQHQVATALYPGGDCRTSNASSPRRSRGNGTCLLFVDGLRFDVGKRLQAVLEDKGCQVEAQPVWAALPSVTATGKPSVTPVHDLLAGQPSANATAAADFEPCVAESGQSLAGGQVLKKLLEKSNWRVLARNECGDGRGFAWTEFGNIDHEGHSLDWKLARQIDSLVREIAARIEELLAAGWQQIQVVTDHGWLLMPGCLPTSSLPSMLVQSKWGRCAILKPGARCQERLFPWYWNPDTAVALADGVSTYRSCEYAHGGLSLQECLTLQMTVRAGTTAQTRAVTIADCTWKGLRCKVGIEGMAEGCSLDLRTNPGQAASSLVAEPKELRSLDEGEGEFYASLVVEDDTLEGREAFLVVLAPDNEPVAQTATLVGGGN